MNSLMDATNAELYKLVLPDFPFVVAAYAVLWIALVIYVSLVLGRLMKLERDMQLVEEACESKQAAAGSASS